MLDFDASKLFIIGIVALLVIGPKDLPRVLRQLGQWTGKMRRMASEFQGQFMDAMREADFDSLKKEVNDAAASANLGTHFDPLGDVHREIASALETNPAAPLATPAEPLPSLSQPSSESATQAAAEPRDAAEESIAVALPYAPRHYGTTHAPQPEPTAATPVVAAASPPVAAPAAKPESSRPSLLGASRADALAAVAKRRTARAQAIAANLRRRPTALSLPSDATASAPKTET
jgi:sec-independent protein translocase protein TatB